MTSDITSVLKVTEPEPEFCNISGIHRVGSIEEEKGKYRAQGLQNLAYHITFISNSLQNGHYQCVRSSKMVGSVGAFTLLIAVTFVAALAKELTYYLDVERVNVTYVNSKYYAFLNASARRFGRWDPIHYIHVHGETLVPFGNNATVDVYVYEFLSNEYRRGFVEMHYKICDLLLKDTVFGPYVNKNLPKVCPIPKGVYHLVNMSVPDLPLLKTFPFAKGRVWANTSMTSSRERIVEGYVDVVIKQRWR